MISSSVHQRKSYTDMSRRGGLVDGEWVVVGWGWGGCIGTRMQMAFITTELFITGYTMGSCQTPPTLRRMAVMCQMSGAAVGFLFLFFFLSKSKFTFSPSVSDQASVSLECNLGEKKEGGQRRKAVHYNYSVQKKNVPPSI